MARRFLADERGASAIVLALVLPVMIGGMGLGAEAGYWFLSERQLQRAADLAAHASAVAKRSGATGSQMREAALRVARGSGFDDARDELTLSTPPASGAYASQEDAAEIVVTRQQVRYLTQIYTNEPVGLTARAVAAVEGGTTACVLALSPSASGAVTIGGSTDVTLEGCDVASNSVASDAFLMQGGGSAVSTGCVNTVGFAETTAGLTLTDCDGVREGAPAAADPYGAVPQPEVTGTCEDGNVGDSNQSTVLTPTDSHPSGVPSMRFCSGLEITGTVVFEPGLYIIEGGNFSANAGAELSGDDVTFFLADGVEMAFNGNADLVLSAPESGPYSGILFFGSRSASGVSHTMNGTADSALDGAVYTPASHLDFSGNFSWDSGCTQLLSSTVTFSGNSTLEVNCSAAGTSPIMTRQQVRLVE